MTIFESDINFITTLDSVMLVKLMRRLMFAECAQTGIPLRAASAPIQVTIADGGEDGRVEWSDGSTSTSYFPARFTMFQSKAQNLTDSTIRAEILKDEKATKRTKKKGPAAKHLSAAVEEVLSRRGAYVIFCSNAFTGAKKDKLKKAVAAAIREGGGDPAQLAAIEIYDANQIGTWVNTHPSVALWLASSQAGRSLAGFQSYDSWGRNGDISNVPWIESDEPRFLPADRSVPVLERKDPSKDAWTFRQAADCVQEHLTRQNAVVRIYGPSGFGKSRFVYEAFRREPSLAEETDRVSLIYADYTIVGEELLKLGLQIAEGNAYAILVVDECPDALHNKLAEIAGRVDSQLRLVTIDVETKAERAQNTLAIRLGRAANEMIGAIAMGIAPTITDSDKGFIEGIADGFPQMAVLAARHNGDGRSTISSTDQFLDRIIWGRRSPDDEARRCIEALSLFEWAGLKGRVSGDGAYIARELLNITEDKFVEHVMSFVPRGIVALRGDYVQITPIPLAARLGSLRLAVLPEGRLLKFFESAPESLKSSLLQRSRWLDASPAAQTFASSLLAPERLGNLAALNTAFGSECLDRLVHVLPDTAMRTIERVFGHLTTDELRSVRDGRRYLVWALEKLAFRKETFFRAATMLRRLAVAENEKRIANNATGQFKQFFHLYLSGTQSPLAPRLLVLDEGLNSTEMTERALCIHCLGEMLRASHFSRAGGAEQIGSGERLLDWGPETFGEIWEFHRAAISRLVDVVISDDEFASHAKMELGESIRELMQGMPFDDVRTMIDRVTAHGGLWLEAIQGVNSWLYFDRKDAPKELGIEVRAYFDSMLPTDPVDLAALYTHGWQTDFNDPDIDYDPSPSAGHDFEYALRKAVELACKIAVDSVMLNRALDRFVTGDAKTVFPFARKLAQCVDDPIALFKTALTKAEASGKEPNRQFFSGLVSGTDAVAPAKARDCIRAALKSSKLKESAISLIGSGTLQPDDLLLVVSLLQAGDVAPWQCTPLSYGRGLDHLSPEDIAPLLDELERHGASGNWAVLDILFMYLFGGKTLAPAIVTRLKRILVAPVLFDAVKHRGGDTHHFKAFVEILIKNGVLDGKFALALTKQIMKFCRRKNSDVLNEMDDSAREALRLIALLHPRMIWQQIVHTFKNKEPLVRARLDRLLKAGRDDHLGQGILYGLPEALYFAWVRSDPDTRAAFVVKWLPLVRKLDDGRLMWHPAIEAFIAEFGAAKGVLGTLSIRLRLSLGGAR